MSDTSTAAFPTGPTGPAGPTTGTDRGPEPESGRHPVNVGHLVMGIAFVCLAVVWSLVEYDVVTGRDIRWLLPVPWVLAGAAGLVASAIAGTRRPQSRQTDWVDQPHHQEETP